MTESGDKYIPITKVVTESQPELLRRGIPLVFDGEVEWHTTADMVAATANRNNTTFNMSNWDQTFDERIYHSPVSEVELETYMRCSTVVYGYIIPFICFVGIVTNIVNLSVLTQRSMWTPTNVFLKGLAIGDLGASSLLIGFFVYFYSFKTYELLDTQQWYTTVPLYWRVFYHIHSIPANILVTASNTLVFGVTIFRFYAVKFPIHARDRCTMRNARILTIVSFAWGIILNLPEFLQKRIEKIEINNDTYYGVTSTDIYYDRTFQSVYYPLKTVLNILLPWVASLVLIIMLIHALWKGMSGRNNNGQKFIEHTASVEEAKQKKSVHITVSLILVNISFLICECPAAVWSMMLWSIPRETLTNDIKFGIARIFIDMFLVLNMSLNFFNYACASQAFRKTLLRTISLRRAFKRMQNKLGAHSSLNKNVAHTYSCEKSDSQSDYTLLSRQSSSRGNLSLKHFKNSKTTYHFSNNHLHVSSL